MNCFCNQPQFVTFQLPGEAAATLDFANLFFKASAMIEAGSVPLACRGALLIGVPPGDLFVQCKIF